ncbi:MAG: class I SAM-dependent methyltransferase, partial [Asticcacaulis sp.]
MTTGRAFITANLSLLPASGVPEIALYRAHPKSGLSRLCGDDQPYWAYGWAGGTVLARYILDHPEAVAGRRVLDLGTGSGIVAIAAAKAGAARVTASDIDRNAIAALGLNAAANGLAVEGMVGDLTSGAPPDVDLIVAGDVFYAAELAARMTVFLTRCVNSGIDVLVGDPGRTHLPHGLLSEV